MIKLAEPLLSAQRGQRAGPLSPSSLKSKDVRYRRTYQDLLFHSEDTDRG